jgi:hypothetical protein
MASGLLVQQHYHFGAPASGYCPLRSPEIQMHSDAHSPLESVRRDNESEIGDRSAHLN